MANILVIEDDVHMLRIISMWLQRNGHRVAEAPNGMIGKQRLQETEIDCVVSDVNMPGVSGVDLVKWLRTEQRSDVPVILLSSRSDQESISEELEPFNVQLVGKPFSPSRLVARIEETLDSRGGALTTAGA